MAIGVVVGLAMEARIARPFGAMLAIGGGTSEGAETAAESLAAGGVTALVSFGLAGGLDPRLKPGDCVVPRMVRAVGQNWHTDPALSQLLGGVTADVLLGESRVAAGAETKRQLWRTTGAVAVDLESGAVAQAAERHGIAFAVLRVICDPADLSLPSASLAMLDARGKLRLSRLFGALARHPLQMWALVALGRDAALACRALNERARAIGALGPSPVHGDIS